MRRVAGRWAPRAAESRGEHDRARAAAAVLESAGLNRCVLRPLPRKLLEKDTFECGFADGLAPANAKSGLSNVQNGVITLDARFRSEPLAKLAARAPGGRDPHFARVRRVSPLRARR